MKYLFSFIYLISSIAVFGQLENSKATDYQAPIFPGCENALTKTEKLKCFQEQIANIYSSYLDRYIPILEYLNINEAKAIVSFKLDENGQIELKNVESNSSFFKVYNVLSFADFMVDQNAKNKIIPVKSLDGSQQHAINLSFPVSVQLYHTNIETKDRVLAILRDNEVRYELRLTPQKEIKIYEVADDRTIYLGKYNTLEEIMNTLPYKKLINTASEWVDLGSFSDEKGEYLIVVKNIFNREKFESKFLIYKLKDGKKKVKIKYNSLKSFMESKYFEKIQRD